MRDDKIEQIVEKYKVGNSTLNEEQVLFDKAKNSEPWLESWSTFVKRNKLEPPKNFNDTLWESFQTKKNRKHRIFVGILSAAASVLVLLSLYIAIPKQKELNYSEKEALLNQALNMVSNSGPEEIQQRIIYENEMIIIYTSTE